MGVCFVVHAGQLTSITRPDRQPFKEPCNLPVRNFPVARLSFHPLKHRLWFSRVEVLQWLSSPPSPGRPVQSLVSILSLDSLPCPSRLLNKSLRRSVLLKRPATLFERFRPHPLVYLFPVFPFVTGWFGCPLRPAMVNMLLWPPLVLPAREDATSNLHHPLSKRRKSTFHPPVRFIVMPFQFIVFSLFIVSLLIVHAFIFISPTHCSFIFIHILIVRSCWFIFHILVLHFDCIRLCSVWGYCSYTVKGGDVVKSTTRWPPIFRSHVETTLSAIGNTQRDSDNQDYNNMHPRFLRGKNKERFFYHRINNYLNLDFLEIVSR
jgi:hypothetical protein